MLIGLSPFLPETALTCFDNLEFLIRILLAGIMGAVVGLERTQRQKAAGIRTHCIVAVTSAVFMILSKYAFLDLAEVTGALGAKGADPSRIASQVVTGISFLGAGVIFRNGNLTITGLTTAAGLWATSALGMALGAGLYWLSLCGTVVLVVIQILFHRHPVGNDTKTTQEVTVKMKDAREMMEAFDQLVKDHHGIVTESSICREGENVCVKTVIRLEEQITHQEACSFIDTYHDVYSISV